MNINWYPGHMKKAIESIEERLHMVDIVIELLDARAPRSSKNPAIDEVISKKPNIVLLNKSDLADEEYNELWVEYFKEKEKYSMAIDSTNKKDINELIKLTDKVTRDRDKLDRTKGIKNRPTRAMIVGIPNVGKSTLINTLSGRRGARVGNRPGVTKNQQWIKTSGNLELLDTPGVLWPKFEDEEVGMHLAFIGSIKDEIVDRETLALRLIERLILVDPKALENRYKINIIEDSGLETMEEIGRKRGCIISGGEIDYTRVSNIVLDEFRKGILGRISLELPDKDVE